LTGFAKNTKHLLLGTMMIQVMPAAFFALFNLLLVEHKYSSSEIGIFNSYRYLVVFLLSVPFGLYLKKSQHRFLLSWSGFIMASSGAIVLLAVPFHSDLAITTGMWIMGLALLIQQASVVPALLEQQNSETSAKVLSWHFAMLSIATILVGLLCFLLELFPMFKGGVSYVLWGSVVVTALGAPLLLSSSNSRPEGKEYSLSLPGKINWTKIYSLLIPQFLISAGAGLSIPYLNLFFQEKWNLSHTGFMLLTTISTLAVILASVQAHRLAKIGGERALCAGSQYLSVACLVGLGFCGGPIGLPIALILFFMRQPLMNMGSPILTKFMMEYVGDDHRRLLGAMSQMSWGLGWFVSSLGYGLLKTLDASWAQIFFVTAVCYFIAGLWYAELMKTPKRLLA
jgi:predicted MFS family arabinose efflux permease